MLHWKRFVVTALAYMMCAAATAPPPALRLELLQSGGVLESRQFACSREEQRCLRRGMLLHAGDGQCYRAGERGPCPEGVLFRADRAEAERRGGHLRGTCERSCARPGDAPLAVDGTCMARAQVDEQVCRAEQHVRAALDVFGQWVCEWTLLPCAPPKPFSLGAASPDDGYYNGVCSAAQLVAHKTLNVTVPPEMPADHPLAKYFLNRSLLHGEFPCTEEEKLCMQYGRVLARDGKCYSPNDFSNLCEPNQSIHVDLEEATKEGGKLQLTCRSACKDMNQEKMVTGECVPISSVYSSMCKYDWGMQSQRDAFGRVGCVCSENAEAPSAQLPQAASAAGLCRAPDFNSPVRAPNFDETLSLGVEAACSAEQLACFADGGKVLAPAPLSGCHALRTQGPCAEGEQLLLDKEALAQARFQAKCAPADGCAAGSVRMPGDGRCLAIQQAEKALCGSAHLALDEFGGWACHWGAVSGFPGGNFSRITRDESSGRCTLPPAQTPFAEGRPGAPGMAEKVMCVNSHLALDEFGGWQCNWEAAFPGGNLSCITRDDSSGMCTLPPSQGHRGDWSPGAPGLARPAAHKM